VRYQIELMLRSICYETVARTIHAGKAALWNDGVTHVKPSVRILSFAGPGQIPDSTVARIDGQSLSSEEFLKRLGKPASVPVSSSGKMVDPYSLQLVKEDLQLSC